MDKQVASQTMSAPVRDIGDLPLSKFVTRITILSAMGVFLDGYDLTILSVALLFITPHFHPAPQVLGLVGAAAVGGMFVGSLIVGNVTDRVGRRKMFLWDMAIFIVFSILAGLSQNMIELGIARFFLGVGIGADYPISGSLTAEFAPTKRRGLMLAMTIGFWQLGALFAYLVGLSMLDIGPDAWRYMLASGAIPAIIVMWLRHSVPESPRWLAIMGRQKEADQIVMDVAKSSHLTVELEATGTTGTPNMGNRGSNGGAFRQLFSPAVIRLTIFAALGWFLFDVGDYGSIVFTPTILKALKGTTVQSSVIASAFLPFVSIIAIIIMCFIVDKIGRKVIQASGFLVMGLVFILMAFSKPSFIVLFPLFLVVFAFMEGGPGQTTYIYAAEVFPTQIRATGHGFATAVSRLGALLGIFVFPIMIASIGLSSGLLLFGACALIGFVLTVWIAPETNNQRLQDRV